MKSKLIKSLVLTILTVSLYFVFTIDLKMNASPSLQADGESLKESSSPLDVYKRTYEVIWYTDEAPTLFKTDILWKALGYIITYQDNHEMYLKVTTPGIVAYVSVDQIHQLRLD